MSVPPPPPSGSSPNSPGETPPPPPGQEPDQTSLGFPAGGPDATRVGPPGVDPATTVVGGAAPMPPVAEHSFGAQAQTDGVQDVAFAQASFPPPPPGPQQPASQVPTPPPAARLDLRFPALAWVRGLALAVVLLVGSAIGALVTALPVLIGLSKLKGASDDPDMVRALSGHGWSVVMQLLGAGYPAGGMHSSFSAAGATTRASLWLVPWLVLVFGLLLVKLFGKFVAPDARVPGWLPRLAIAAVSGLVFAGVFILLVATAPFRMSGEDGGGVFTVTTGSFWRAAVAFAIATAAVFLLLLPRERGRVRAALRSATSTVTEHLGSLAVIGAVVMLWFGLQRLGEATIVRPIAPDDESVLQGLRAGAYELMGGGDTDVFTAIAKSIPFVFLFALPWLGPDIGLNGVSLTHLIPSGFHGGLTTRDLSEGGTDRFAFGRDGLTDSVSLVGHGVAWWVWLVAAVAVLLWILLASLRWRIRRGVPGPMLDVVWLPLVYAVAGVVVTFAGRMAFHAEADADGAVPLWGSGYIGPEWWGIFIFLGLGVLVEGASRLIAVPALKAAPRWIIGLVSIGLGRKQPIAPAGRPVGELRPSASKGAKFGWGLTSSLSGPPWSWVRGPWVWVQPFLGS